MRFVVLAGAAVAGGLLASSCSVAFDLGRQQCDGAEDCEGSGIPGAVCEENVCVAPEGPGQGGGPATSSTTTTVGTGGAGGGTGGSGSGGEDPRWGCLGSFEAPVPEDTVVYPFRIELATSAGNPPPGLSIRLCPILDVDCQSPVEGIDQPDENGDVSLELAPSFKGFIEVTATDLMPTLVFLPRLVVLPPKRQIIRVVREVEFAAIVSSSGQEFDPTRGVAILLTEDCQQERAGGVKLTTASADEATIPFYFKGLLPDFDATQSDEEGAGGWVNLPVGFLSAEARLAATDEFIGVATFDSRPNTLSYVPIGPTEP